MARGRLDHEVAKPSAVDRILPTPPERLFCDILILLRVRQSGAEIEMHRVSASLPSGAPIVGSSDGDDAAAPAPPELLQTSSLWKENIQHHPNIDTLESQSKSDFDFDNEFSPVSSAHSSVIDLNSAAGSDSDFEVVEGDELPQGDGQNEQSTSSSASRTLSDFYSRARRSVKSKATYSSGEQDETGLPGTSTMEAGGSSSSANYDDTDWQQAGHDATAQDLAGPGVHGFLECTVSSPQKEGEGTQNAYISYLVTTEVRIVQNKPSPHSVYLQSMLRPTSNHFSLLQAQ